MVLIPTRWLLGTAWVWPLGVLSCFTGDATLGAFCERVTDCGPDQGCTNSVCGRCGDGERNAGEVCLVGRVDVDAPEGHRVIAPLDVDADGSTEMFLATAADDAFGLRIVTLAGKERFEVTDLPHEPLSIAMLGPHDARPAMFVVHDAEQLSVWSVDDVLRPIATAAGSFRAVAGLSRHALAIVPNEGAHLLLGTLEQDAETDATVLTLEESSIAIGPGARVAVAGRDVLGTMPALAVYDETGQVLLLARSDDGRSVTSLAALSVTGPIQELYLHDIDGDAAPDVIRIADQRVVARFGPRWDADVVLAEGLSPRALAVADIDHDGAPDLVVASTTSELRLAPQRAAVFPLGHRLELEAAPAGVVAGDLDRDFRLEVLAFHGAGWSTFSEEP